MKSILNNPYRITGLLAGATARERTTKIRRLRTYLEAGEQPPAEGDFAFPLLGKLNRTVDSVNEAASKLDLDSDRIDAALLWFYAGNASDENAFDFITDDDRSGIAKALEIWAKLTDSGTIRQTNYSAFQNLSSLQLCRSLQFEGNAAVFKSALKNKLKFLESDYINDFAAKVNDATFVVNKSELESNFLRTLLKDVKNAKLHGITPEMMMETLASLRFEAKDAFMKEFIQVFVSGIEQEVKANEQKRKETPGKADSLGNSLYSKVSTDLKKLKDIAGDNNLKYTSTADMVAEEILNCAIDCLNSGMEKINPLFFQLKELSEQEKSSTVDNAFKLLTEASPLLKKMKKAIAGIKSIDVAESLCTTASNIAASVSIKQKCEDEKNQMLSSRQLNDAYMKISSNIASNALDMIIDIINNEMKNSDENGEMKNIVNNALDIIELIEKMDLTPNFKERLITNKKTLTEIKNQVEKPAVNPEVMGAIEELMILVKKGNTLTDIIIEDIIENAKPLLYLLKTELGRYDENYLQISTTIASKVLNACIAFVNDAQQNFDNDLVSLAYDVNLAWTEMEKLQDMDLLSDFNERLQANRPVLLDLRSKLYRVDIPIKYDPYKIASKKEKAAKAANMAKAAREGVRRSEAEKEKAAKEAKKREAEYVKMRAVRAAEEAEEAKRRAAEEAEYAKRRAAEEAEYAKRRAAEEAEEAKRRAAREAEEAKRKAAREAEEAKRKAAEAAEEAKQVNKQVSNLLNRRKREQTINEANNLLKEAKPLLKKYSYSCSSSNCIMATSRIASVAIDMVNAQINATLVQQVITQKMDTNVIRKAITGAVKVAEQLNKMELDREVNDKKEKLAGVIEALGKKIGVKSPFDLNTAILWFNIRGRALWAATKYIFCVTLIFFSLLVLSEVVCHALSAPPNKFLNGLPYSFLLMWFFLVVYGLVSMVKRRLPAFGVFLEFVANLVTLAIIASSGMMIRKIEVLSLTDKIPVWAFVFVALFYAMSRLKLLKDENPGDYLNSTMFRLRGTPGVMYFSYLIRSLIIPIIAFCVLSLGNLSLNTVWRAVFCIYGFLLLYENIRVMLLCNMRRLKRSKMSQFLHTQHVVLFLPEAALFLIWYFDWLPMPKWVSGVFIVYAFFWLIATISILTAKKY
jgi:hypothetical protein